MKRGTVIGVLAGALIVAACACAIVVSVRALWMNGFATGSTSAECVDLFTVVGDEARNYDACIEARRRFQYDPLARAFAEQAESNLRNEGIEH